SGDGPVVCGDACRTDHAVFDASAFGPLDPTDPGDPAGPGDPSAPGAPTGPGAPVRPPAPTDPGDGSDVGSYSAAGAPGGAVGDAATRRAAAPAGGARGSSRLPTTGRELLDAALTGTALLLAGWALSRRARAAAPPAARPRRRPFG